MIYNTVNLAVEVYGNLSKRIQTFQQDLPAVDNTFNYAHPDIANLDGDLVDIRVGNETITVKVRIQCMSMLLLQRIICCSNY